MWIWTSLSELAIKYFPRCLQTLPPLSELCHLIHVDMFPRHVGNISVLSWATYAYQHLCSSLINTWDPARFICREKLKAARKEVKKSNPLNTLRLHCARIEVRCSRGNDSLFFFNLLPNIPPYPKACLTHHNMTLFTGNYSDQCRLTAACTTTRGCDGTNQLPVK